VKTDTTLSRRRLLASVPAVAATVPPRRNRAGWARYGRGSRSDLCGDRGPQEACAVFNASFNSHGADSSEVDEAADYESDTFWDVFEVEPTTAAGLVTLFEYLASSRYDDRYSNLKTAFETWEDEQHITESEWMTMISGALRKLLAA
jgi:hypothetical protein